MKKKPEQQLEWLMREMSRDKIDLEKEKNDFIQRIKKLKKDTKWLNKCTFLCANNKVVHRCREIGCNNQFIDSSKFFEDEITSKKIQKQTKSFSDGRIPSF